MWEAPTELYPDHDPYVDIDDPYYKDSQHPDENQNGNDQNVSCSNGNNNNWYLTPYDTDTPIFTDESVVDDGFHCAVCGITNYSIEAYQEHVVSEEHVKLTAKSFKYGVGNEKVEAKKDSKIHYCSICDINCTGLKSFGAHTIGAKHKKKAKAKQLEDAKAAAVELANAAPKKIVPIIRMEGEELPSMVKEEFAQSKEALIGLEYVIEIQLCEDEPPRFYCGACEMNFDYNFRIPHLIGVKHRLRVLKEKDYAFAKKIQSSCEKRSALTKRLDGIAFNMEKNEGRGVIKVITEAEYNSWRELPNGDSKDEFKSISSNERKPIINNFVAAITGGTDENSNGDTDEIFSKKPKVEEKIRPSRYSGPYANCSYNDKHSSNSSKRYRRSPSESPPRKRVSTSVDRQRKTDSSKSYTEKNKSPSSINKPKKVNKLLSELSECDIVIENETEAALIFNVSNALTEALLKYRLKNNSSETIREFRSENTSVVRSLPVSSTVVSSTISTVVSIKQEIS